MTLKKVEKVDKHSIKPLSPNFSSRISCLDSLSEIPPFRAYIHNSSSFAFIPTSSKNLEEQVFENLIRSLDKNFELIKNSDFLITAVWRDDVNKMIDLFCYSIGKGNWLKNPDISSYVLKNGVLSKECEYVATCGDTVIVLGEEEKYRRKTKDILDYFEHPPQIENLRFI